MSGRGDDDELVLTQRVEQQFRHVERALDEPDVRTALPQRGCDLLAVLDRDAHAQLGVVERELGERRRQGNRNR